MKILRNKEDGDNGGTAVMPSVSIDQEIANFEGGGSYPKGDEGGGDNKDNSAADKDIKVEDRERSPAKLDEGGDALKKLPSLEDMAKVIGDNTTKVLSKPKPTNDKKEVKPDTEEDETPDTQNQPPVRDLEGFGDKEKIWLKRMPYDGYEYFSKLIRESRSAEATFKSQTKKLEEDLVKAREGKVQLPESYYDNPEAAWLMPEVREIQGQVTLASQIENHWKQQLIAVKAGKSWYDLETGKDGKIYVSQQANETTAENKDELEVAISQEFQRSINQTTAIRSRLDQTIGGFKTKHQERMSALRAYEDKIMPLFTEANKDSEEYKVYKTVADEIHKGGISKDNPAYNMLAKSCALNLILRDYINTQLSKQKTTEAVKADQKKAGPTGASFNGGAVKTQIPTPSIADFEKMGLPKIKI